MSSSTEKEIAPRENIVFFHPDLGIGGAERLIIDAAVGLQERGHKVTIFTNHCDPKHCFEEAQDGTLDVRVRGTLLPTSICSRLTVLFSSLRQLHLLFIILVNGELRSLKPTLFFVDQLAISLPLLRILFSKTPILFYCHFPDLLLARRNSIIKCIYRFPFDWAEGQTMLAADAVVFNSKFTREKVVKLWPTLYQGEGGRLTEVVYPCVKSLSKEEEEMAEEARKTGNRLWKGKKTVLSLNRFEDKKEIEIAIKAFAGLDEEKRKQSRLVIAGGYDPLHAPDSVCLTRLTVLCDKLELPHLVLHNLATALSPSIPSDISVVFLLSIPTSLKTTLLTHSSLLLYTPADEHFGIVPVESMRVGLPVLARRSGGPMESIVDGETGFLRDSEPISNWTEVIERVLFDMPQVDLDAMASKGRARVQELFLRDMMIQKLEECANVVLQRTRKGRRAPIIDVWQDLIALTMVLIMTISMIYAMIMIWGRNIIVTPGFFGYRGYSD